MIECHPATDVDDLSLDNVFAAIIPYRSGVAENDAIVVPNKALQLFARGIPLAITGMPGFIRLPFVFRLGNGAPI